MVARHGRTPSSAPSTWDSLPSYREVTAVLPRAFSSTVTPVLSSPTRAVSLDSTPPVVATETASQDTTATPARAVRTVAEEGRQVVTLDRRLTQAPVSVRTPVRAAAKMLPPTWVADEVVPVEEAPTLARAAKPAMTRRAAAVALPQHPLARAHSHLSSCCYLDCGNADSKRTGFTGLSGLLRELPPSCPSCTRSCPHSGTRIIAVPAGTEKESWLPETTMTPPPTDRAST